MKLRSLLFLAAAAQTLATPAAETKDDALNAWFAKPADDRGAPPSGPPLTRAASDALLPSLISAARSGATAAGLDKLLPAPASLESLRNNPPAAPLRPGTIKTMGFEMPFVLLAKGEKPKDGWPLFLCLHGGGGNDKAPGPHSWDVNSREWQAQVALFERVYAPAGIYFIPRMADDRKGRWYFDHNQDAFDKVIRAAIAFLDVNPDRVCMLGISEGGYGAIRFAGNRPDRFAATNGMAAAEPLDTSPTENMRNVALRIDIGENDTMFDRVGLARRMGDSLTDLHLKDPGGYDFLVNIQKGRGHGIDYAPGPQWIASKTRNPWPDRVVWTVRPFDRSVALQNYWLALPAAPDTMPLRLSAAIKNNTVTLSAETDSPGGTSRLPASSGRILIRLNDHLADLDQPVTVILNGKPRPPVTVQRSLATMALTMAERGDPRLCFPAEISVDLTSP